MCVRWVVATWLLACSGSEPKSEPTAPPLDEHYIPASQVAMPGRVVAKPPPVVPPSIEMLRKPPRHNPGGVNGDRPARPVIGIVAGAPHGELKTLGVMADSPEAVHPATIATIPDR